MATKKRFIEVVSTKLKFEDDVVFEKPNFSSILQFLNNKEYRTQGKIFELSLFKTEIEDCIVGIIITTQDRDIPPIRNKGTKVYSRVSINPIDEGMAFGNIFLYDKKRNILLYEINKNGCFLDKLIDFTYSEWNSVNEDVRFDISFPVVLRKNEYDRMLSMDYYKRVTIELFNPSELIDCFNETKNSIQNNLISHNIIAAKETNANTLVIEQIALNKRINPRGLNRSIVTGLVDSVKVNIADIGFRRNIQKLKVEGYSSDVEDSKRIKPVDLLADSFKEFFRITDVQIQSDVQEDERKIGIEKLYKKLLPELNQLINPK